MCWIAEIKEYDSNHNAVEAHLINSSGTFTFSAPTYVEQVDLPEELQGYEHGMKVIVNAVDDGLTNQLISDEESVLEYDGEPDFNEVNGVIYVYNSVSGSVVKSKPIKGRVRGKG